MRDHTKGRSCPAWRPVLPAAPTYAVCRRPHGASCRTSTREERPPYSRQLHTCMAGPADGGTHAHTPGGSRDSPRSTCGFAPLPPSGPPPALPDADTHAGPGCSRTFCGHVLAPAPGSQPGPRACTRGETHGWRPGISGCTQSGTLASLDIPPSSDRLSLPHTSHGLRLSIRRAALRSACRARLLLRLAAYDLRLESRCAAATAGTARRR